ncbi:double-strand break repair protein AddB [Rickettsiales bacterium]|nr:double-strand break repair protein AddB [Rickettsiales bacterium]
MNIYNINSDIPFLKSLVQGILARYGDNLLDLSSIKILLPNRRSCRALRDRFLVETNGKPLLLPSMHPIGDLGEDEFLTNISLGKEIADMPPIMPVTQRRLILARLIKEWHGNEHINTIQATNLAVELSLLLDEIQIEQLPLEGLVNIVPDDLANHWQITLEFLKILIDKWPEVLQKEQKNDPITHRNNILSMQAKYWQESPPDYPVIIAGSTGSTPATRQLIKAVASMKQGSVILPGIDENIDEKSWEYITPTHPQYILKQLLGHLKIERKNIRPWHDKTCRTSNREELFSEIMRPAETSDDWQYIENIPEYKSAMQNIELIEAASSQEEAAIIALNLRYALQEKGKTASLVTPDRALARRVISIMKRWNVNLDDSAGTPLSQTPPAIFMLLVAQMIESRFSPVSLLNCLKHPLAAAGESPVSCRKKIRNLEKAHLRGMRNESGLEYLINKSDKKISLWLKNLLNITKPFTELLKQKQVSLRELVKIHIEVAENLAKTDLNTGSERLWSKDEGIELKAFFDQLYESSASFGHIDPSEYGGVLSALMAGSIFRPKYGSHPRISILSPLEARLQNFDLIILGGLNEQIWPQSISADPWMNQSMRSEYGLKLNDQRIGQSAHDFVQMFNTKNVILTRCLKSQGSQTIPSRWLQRIQIILKSINSQQALNSKHPWNIWAKSFIEPEYIKNISPPCPKPELKYRPKKLSVTQIEKLIRDPYSVYANKILKLKPLDLLDQDPGPAEFGNFIHNALENFVKKYDDIADNQYESFLLQCGQQAFEDDNLNIALKSIWWPRFENITKWFVENEKSRRSEINFRILAEEWGEYKFETTYGNFTLVAKADRIESTKDGISIIDYKTGTVPKEKDVKLGLSPQIILEGLIVQAGGFALKGIIKEAGFWKLSGAGKTPVDISKYDGEKLQLIIENAQTGLKNLIEYFNNENTPYYSCPSSEIAPRYNDYAHLARIKEWE